MASNPDKSGRQANMIAKHIFVTGIVQGVGFRPFVYGLATQLGLDGWVKNTSGGVEIVVQGFPEVVNKFLHRFPLEIPALAQIDRMETCDFAVEQFIGFQILESTAISGVFQPISADIAICPDCERELFDPQDRRYLYPFINCTNCGPRLTIIKDLPYDRPQTTMADFHMCRACRSEYEDPRDRRFHAQPVACPDCGPQVELRCPGSESIVSGLPAILEARRLLSEGKILAVKGLGGFHLACDASQDAAVKELRRRKGRVDKPFAMMAADMVLVESFCEMGDAERILLGGREKPIVLLRRRTGSPVVEQVAPGLDSWGVMLPYSPLHHLLLNQSDPILRAEPTPEVLVMTSGNLSEEPIASDNREAMERLEHLADAFLLHNRDIHIRSDDSVLRVDRYYRGRSGEKGEIARRYSPPAVYLRRSRGYAPYPVHLPFDTQPTLATGGELKNTFCLTREHYAFLSHHIGDMENVETYESFEQGVQHFSRLFRIQPEIIACDMHPNYFTTSYARSRATDAKLIAVQHHHAHITACMADNGLENHKVIGLSFDGTGYGTDGKIWGGEFLVADYSGFERAAHLEYMPLPGGDAAIRSPWRIAFAYATSLGLKVDDLPFLQNIDPEMVRIVRLQMEKGINTAQTSSMGRLFDAVASLAGVRNQATYEAQAAIELEVQSRPLMHLARAYPYEIDTNGSGLLLRLEDLLSAALEDARSRESAGYIGACFHRAIADASVEICLMLARKRGLKEVVLSGGVWQNEILLGLVREGLEKQGFSVYCHGQTPTNDGGIALGQAAVANHVHGEVEAAEAKATPDFIAEPISEQRSSFDVRG